MNTAQTSLSLPELRSRTDRELVILVGKEIERSLKFAGRGAIAEAEAAHHQARVLLRVARAPDPQRSEMETRLDHARAAIDRSRPAPMPRAQSVSC
jgi:precorrin-6x reductase